MQVDTQHNKHHDTNTKLQQKYEKEKAERATLFRTSIDALAQSMEVALSKACVEMARSLAEKEKTLSVIFEDLQNTLVGLEHPALVARHAQIETTQLEITQLLDEFERTLQCAEQVRQQHAVQLIGKSLRDTMDIRRGVPTDVLQSLADETKKISAAILRNREVYATIASQLRMKALELDKQIDLNWSSVGHTWRILNYKHTIEKFKQALASGAYRNPPARIATLEALRASQRTHHTRMLDQLHSVFRLTPPSQLTPTSVEEWQLALKSVLLQAASEYKRATQTLRAQEDVMHTSCAELVAKLREDLREFRVVDDRDMSAIIVECRGLLDVRGRDSLALLAHVEAVLEVHTTAVMRACNSLCHYLTRVSALLEIQERECNVLRTAHQEKLSQLHAGFTAMNETQEEKLQLVISFMQGEVDDEELYRHLQKALDILRAIEEGYRNYCSSGVSLSVDYPNDTKAMLTQQQEAICMIFGLTQDESVWRASKKATATAIAILKEAEQKEAEIKENAEKDDLKGSVERRPKKKGAKVVSNLT